MPFLLPYFGKANLDLIRRSFSKRTAGNNRHGFHSDTFPDLLLFTQNQVRIPMKTATDSD